jgi:hypothetical protein
MELAKSIELAPKNGDFVVLQDGWSGSWEVGRWAPESSNWVQIDGKPLRIFPTHWVPVSGDTVGLENTEGLSFLVPAIQVMEPPQKRLRTRFIQAFAVAAILVGGYAAFDFDFNVAGPAKDSSFDKIVLSAAELRREVSGERDGAGVIVGNLAPAREEIAFLIAPEDAVEAEALEAERIVDLKQRKLKQALDESEARAQALARELASVRVSAGKPFNENVVRRSPTGPLDHPIQESNAVSGTTGVLPNTQSLDELTAGTLTFSNTRSAPTSAGPDDTVVEPMRLPARPRQSLPTSAISSADEARLVARAEFLIKQSDFSAARLLLEHAVNKGSARAAFMMAETYDWRMLRSIQAHGVRGDSEKAQQLYELAAGAGIEKARERLEALKSSSPPDAVSFGEERRNTRRVHSREPTRAGPQGISNGLPNGGANSAPRQTAAAALYSALFNGKATKKATPTSPTGRGSTLWPQSTVWGTRSE